MKHLPEMHLYILFYTDGYFLWASLKIKEQNCGQEMDDSLLTRDFHAPPLGQPSLLLYQLSATDNKESQLVHNKTRVMVFHPDLIITTNLADM